MTAAKKHPTKAAAVRHHTDPPHPAEVDIDLNSHCSDPELQILLKLLRPLLREVIKASKRCKHHHHKDHKIFNVYHNITACDGSH